MDAARQVIRWSIPGSVLLLVFGLIYLLLAWSWGYSTAELLDHRLSARVGGAKGLAALLSSVPLGFLVYQLYYATYAQLPLPFGIVSFDRGSDILRHIGPVRADVLRRLVGADTLDTDEMTFETVLHGPFGIRVSRFLRLHPSEDETLASTRARYVERERINWGIVRTCIDLGAPHNGSNDLKCEYTMLSDIYHGVGATRVAVVLAAAGAGLYTVGFHWHRVVVDTAATVRGAAFAGVLVFVLLYAMRVARNSALHSLTWTLRNGVHWLFETGRLPGLPPAGVRPRPNGASSAPGPGSRRSPASPSSG